MWKEGNYRKQCRSKSIERGKGSDDASSTKAKTSVDEGGYVYLDSSSTHENHEAWLVDLDASFHMTPQREWLCEYERYNGGDIFLGED
jgi:hypothetical protein